MHLKRSALALVVVLSSFTIVSAEWFEVAGGTGDVCAEVLSHSIDHTAYRIIVPGIEMTEVYEDSVLYTRLEIPGASPAHGVVGRPECQTLPMLSAIPYGAELQFVVDSVQFVAFEVARAYPQQPPSEWGGDSKNLVIDTAFYKLDTTYPADRATMHPACAWRTLDVVNTFSALTYVNPGG